MPSIIKTYLLVLGALIIGLASRSSSYRHLFFVVALSIFSYILATPYPDEDPPLKYNIGLTGCFIIAAVFDSLFLQPNPQEAIRHNKQLEPASQLGFFSRIKWGTNLLFNVRGSNWNNAVRGLRYPKQKTRWGFVLTRLMWAGFYYLIGDVVGAFTRRNPAWNYPPTESMSARGLPLQAANVLLFWIALFSLQNRLYTFLSALTVALGIYEPDDWPAFFGVFSEATSIRSFWGRSWHQSVRRSVQPHSKFLTRRILHLQPTSLITPYIELYTCFFLSGVYHATGDWVTQKNISVSRVTIEFFIIQATIITFEDFLTFIGKKVGITRVPKFLSYAWVIGWLTVTCPAWVEGMLAGDNLSYAPDFSVVEMALTKFGVGESVRWYR